MRLTDAWLIGVVIGFQVLLGAHNNVNYRKYLSSIEDKLFHGNLNPSENKWTTRSCGQRFQPDDFVWQVWRAKRGALAKEKEYPWTVLITGMPRHCSGALISTRHVLTSAYCVTKRLDNKDCQHRSPDDPSYEPVKATDTFVYRGRKNPVVIGPYSAPYRVVNITIHPLYDPCVIYGDLALLEISPNMFTDGLPICMPTKNEEVPKNLTTTRFFYSPQPRLTYYLEAINFTLNATDNANQQLIAVTEGQLCLRDMGGPIFKVNGSKHTLLGLATLNNQCSMKTGYLNLFEGVRNFTDWVCQNSGVCHVK